MSFKEKYISTQDPAEELPSDEELTPTGTFDDSLYASDRTKRLRVKEYSLRCKVDEHRLLTKLDLHVLPPFMLVYFLGFLTRSNIGTMQIEGIYTSLKMTDHDYASAYAAFFAPYIAFQFVSNVLLKRVRPHFWIAVSVLLYGSINLATGYVKSYGAFVACQFLHGFFQAGVETAMFYILAHYYEKRESQRRFSAIYSVSCISGAVGTSIAFAIDTHLAGHRGLESWRWLLIIEGAMTMACSFVLFFTVPDFPENARFIDDNETTFLISKLELFQGKSGFELEISIREFVSMLFDPVIILPAFASLGICYATYCYAFFEPVFVSQIRGGTIADSNKYSVFPWICAFFYCNINSYLSDRLKMRFPFLITNILLIIVGGALTYSHPLKEVPDAVKYAGCFVVCCASYTAAPILICWTSTNLCGHSRKNLGTTMVVSFGSFGGLVTIFPFIGIDNRYFKGFAVGFVILIMGMLFAIAYFFVLRNLNKKKRTNDFKSKFSQYSARKQILLGDQNPAFDYMY